MLFNPPIIFPSSTDNLSINNNILKAILKNADDKEKNCFFFVIKKKKQKCTDSKLVIETLATNSAKA